AARPVHEHGAPVGGRRPKPYAGCSSRSSIAYIIKPCGDTSRQRSCGAPRRSCPQPNRPEPTMRLTNFTDYALRVLMYAAAHRDRLITIEETAQVYGISRAHLMKVANQLARAGFLVAVRGRSGGLKLAKTPEQVG